jgi:hypothetical protein
LPLAAAAEAMTILFLPRLRSPKLRCQQQLQLLWLSLCLVQLSPVLLDQQDLQVIQASRVFQECQRNQWTPIHSNRHRLHQHRQNHPSPSSSHRPRQWLLRHKELQPRQLLALQS